MAVFLINFKKIFITYTIVTKYKMYMKLIMTTRWSFINVLCVFWL